MTLGSVRQTILLSRTTDRHACLSPEKHRFPVPAQLCPVEVGGGGRMSETHPAGESLHNLYVTAINSNDVQEVAARLSDNVVFQTPGEAELVGKEAVTEWASSFFEAFEAHWDKTEQSIDVSGDLAVSRYTYSARIQPREGGAPMEESGKGTCVYRRSEDGKWLLAIDSWSTNEAVED